MRRTGIAALLMVVALSAAALALAQTPDPPARVERLSIETLRDGVAVLVRTSGAVPYQTIALDAPPRLVIDLEGATLTAPRARWTSAPEPIREVRASQWKPSTARVVVELQRRADYRVERSATGLRVLITAPPSEPAAPGAAASEPATSSVPETQEREAAAEPVAAAGPPDPGGSPPLAGSAPDLPAAQQVAQAQPIAPPAPPPPAPAPAPAESPAPPPAPAPAQAPGPMPTTGQAPGTLQSTPANGSRLLTLEFKDADVVNLLRILAAESQRNLVVGDDVKGKVSVSLRNVTWEQALDTILEVRGLRRIEKDNVIRIVSLEQLRKEREAQAAEERAQRLKEAETRQKEAEAKQKEIEARELAPKLEMEARTKLADTRLKLAEAERKELEVQRKRLAEEEEAAKAQARGPLREEVLRIFYADPGEIANTLQGILGLPDRTIDPCRVVEAEKAGFKVKFSTGGGAVSGPIAEPPFSQLFGPPRPPEELPPPPPLPPEVVAKGLAIRAYCPTNSLFLRLYAADLERIKKLIREQLDVPLPQVKIEARMEVLDRSALEQIGIQWGGAGVAHPNPDKTPALVGRGFATPVFPGGTPTVGSFGPNPNFNPSGSGTFNFLPVDPTSGIPTGGSIVNLPVSALPTTLGGPAFGALFGLVGKSYNLDLALQALATQGKTRTLARPEIITMENSRATVSLGEEIPYATVSSAGTQVQFKEALLKLEVVPTVLAGEKVAGREQTKIKMVVVVENNSRGETVNLGTSGQPPAINKRKAETLVLINEGERLVISGVTTATRRDTVRKVPILGDIPLLGWLFKQKENFEEGRELVIFITPSVLQLVQGRLAAPAPAR